MADGHLLLPGYVVHFKADKNFTLSLLAEIHGILDLPRHITLRSPLVTFKDIKQKMTDSPINQTKKCKTHALVRLFESIHVKSSG